MMASLRGTRVDTSKTIHLHLNWKAAMVVVPVVALVLACLKRGLPPAEQKGVCALALHVQQHNKRRTIRNVRDGAERRCFAENCIRSLNYLQAN